MKITFGKFQGWTADNLAKAGEPGRNYLAWGAEHLKSPEWRSIFQEALNNHDPFRDIDAALMAAALVVVDSELNWNDAESLAQEEVAEVREYLDMIDKQADVIKKAAGFLNREFPEVPVETWTTALNSRITCNPRPIQFTSQKKKERFQAAVAWIENQLWN